MQTLIEKSKRKTISITIINDKVIKVKAPLSMGDSEINKFIESKRNWIEKNVICVQKNNSEFSEILNYNRAFLYGNEIDYSSQYKKSYISEAKKYLSKRIVYLAEVNGFKYNSVNIREFKSKWGSCSADKNILLNARLVMLNKRVIDYVIMHELCHTVYMNHKTNFHRLLSSFFSDEKEIKLYLKKMSFLTRIKY